MADSAGAGAGAGVSGSLVDHHPVAALLGAKNGEEVDPTGPEARLRRLVADPTAPPDWSGESLGVRSRIRSGRVRRRVLAKQASVSSGAGTGPDSAEDGEGAFTAPRRMASTGSVHARDDGPAPSQGSRRFEPMTRGRTTGSALAAMFDSPGHDREEDEAYVLTEDEDQ